MPQPFFRVNAFASSPFSGNPAGVCLLDEPAEDAWMQAVAREMGLPATAFVAPDGGSLSLRWFAPQAEIDLCGHGTLACAHILWEINKIEKGSPAVFQSSGGVLTARKVEDPVGEADGIALDFPAITAARWADAPDLGLGVKPLYVGRAGADVLVELSDETQLRQLRPDLPAVAELDCRGVIVTAPAVSQRFDFVSRFFAPGIGIDEDAVTGSAHCALGPHWQHRFDQREFVAYQASSRGGVVGVAVQGDRVTLTGQALTVMRGGLFI